MIKENQRVAFSKELLKNAALTLNKEKIRKDITVTALCKEAGVSRDTFYKHYSSVDDVFKEIYAETEKFLSEKITELNNPKTMKKSLIAYLNYIRDNSLLFESMLNINSIIPKEMESIENKSISAITSLMRKKDNKENEMTAFFLYAGVFAIMSKWIEKMDNMSTAELAEIILKFSEKLMR